MNSGVPAGRSVAVVDLTALAHNARVLKAHAGGAALMAVVKADAYGHGVDQVVRALMPVASMFAVANVTEALEVQRYAPGIPIFLLGPALPEERAQVAAAGVIPAVSGVEEAAAYSEIAGLLPPMEVHLAIDTGMGRIGTWMEDAEGEALRIASLPGVRLTGVATHLPVADEDADFTRSQLRGYAALVQRIRARLPGTVISHSLNSAGIIGYPEFAPDLVRAGLALYGSSPIPDFQSKLKPVVHWTARVTMVRQLGAGRSVSYGRTFTTSRPTVAATLAVGYADGYPRVLSGRGAEVLLGGKRCPVLGRVTMDQIVVDATEVPGVKAGDVATLIGRDGTEEISTAELAAKAMTIPWEIMTGLQNRVRRHYTGQS